MDDLDININHYSHDELLDLGDLDETATIDEVNNTFNSIIQKYRKENFHELAQFFTDAKEKLLSEKEEEDEDEEDEDEEDEDEEDEEEEGEEGEEGEEDEEVEEDEEGGRRIIRNNKKQPSFLRDHNTKVFSTKRSPHAIMSRQNLGVNNTVPLKVAQDQLNPTLRQTLDRYITIDSQFREHTIPFNNRPNNTVGSATNFSCTLTEKVHNVLSMRLQNVHIPRSWYTFDPFYDNTCFWILTSGNILPPDNNGANHISPRFFADEQGFSCNRICVPPGTYNTPLDLVSAINHAIFTCANPAVVYGGPVIDTVGPWVPSDISGVSQICSGCPDYWTCFTNPTNPSCNASLNNCFGPTPLRTPGVSAQLINSDTDNPKIVFFNTTPYSIKLVFWEPNLQMTGSPFIGDKDISHNCFHCNTSFDECRNRMTYTTNLGYYLGYRITRSDRIATDIPIGLYAYMGPALLTNYARSQNGGHMNGWEGTSNSNHAWYEAAGKICPYYSNLGRFLDGYVCGISSDLISLHALGPANLLGVPPLVGPPIPTANDPNIYKFADTSGNYGPEPIIRPPQHDLYAKAITIIMNILGNFAPIFEDVSHYFDHNTLWPDPTTGNPVFTLDKRTVILSNLISYTTANVPLNWQGSQYFYLVLDDFTQNKPASGMIGISPNETQLSLPSYANKLSVNYKPRVTQVEALADPTIAVVCDTSLNDIGKGNSLYVPTWPRNVTQNQLYAINQIISNRSLENIRYAPPDLRDVFATLYIGAPERNGVFQSTQLEFKRNYFGPVTIERLKIQLYDDKGNLVNLNGRDWSFTLIVEQLYQY